MFYLVVCFGDATGVFRQKFLPSLQAGGQIFNGLFVILVFDRNLAQQLVRFAQLCFEIRSTKYCNICIILCDSNKI